MFLLPDRLLPVRPSFVVDDARHHVLVNQEAGCVVKTAPAGAWQCEKEVHLFNLVHGGAELFRGPCVDKAIFPYLGERVEYFDYRAAFDVLNGIHTRQLVAPGLFDLKDYYDPVSVILERMQGRVMADSSEESQLYSLLERGESLLNDFPQGGLVLTHGDPHLANWVGDYCLVDWESAVFAPPEQDYAVFLMFDIINGSSMLKTKCLPGELDLELLQSCIFIKCLTALSYALWRYGYDNFSLKFYRVNTWLSSLGF